MKIVNLSTLLVLGATIGTISLTGTALAGFTQALPFVHMESGQHKMDDKMMTKCHMMMEQKDQANTELKEMMKSSTSYLLR